MQNVEMIVMAFTRRKFLSILSFGAAALLFNACSASPTQRVSAPIQRKRLSPVKIAVFLDKTKSIDVNRVQPVSMADLVPIMDCVRHRGGELAVGLIRDDSNRSLERLLVPEPPESPTSPDEMQNPFLLAERRSEYEKESRAYKLKMERWQVTVDQNMAAFQDRLALLLKSPADAGRTDVWSAVRRAELFLSEPEDCWGSTPIKYTILVTDGEDNVRRKNVEIRSGSKILVVNGAAALGCLENLQPVRFESVPSAVQYIVSRETSRERS
jgi:hypothetical protein